MFVGFITNFKSTSFILVVVMSFKSVATKFCLFRHVVYVLQHALNVRQHALLSVLIDFFLPVALFSI